MTAMQGAIDVGCISSAATEESLLVQAMPTGEQTDFILVSCAGALVADDEPVSAAAVLSHKRKGEQALRHSGLGYTIIRPGPLLEEPGGYKALVFDQVRPPATSCFAT